MTLHKVIVKHKSMRRRPVIGIAGLACECSTFTPSRTSAQAFHPKLGTEIIDHYKFLHQDRPLGNVADWQGALIGHALPGGIVKAGDFEQLMADMLARLRHVIASYGQLDGLWLDIHGALFVEGIQDAESELLRRVRGVIGTDVLVSASMDLHGNVSGDLVHQTDLITCYRTAPHVDVYETKERACRNLIVLLNSQEACRRPLKMWIPVPILLPGEQTSTRDEPSKHIYDTVAEVAQQEHILDAAIWVGYAWADEARSRATVVVTGWRKDIVAAGAERLARLFWDSREQFAFVAPTGSLEGCVTAALASRKRPFFISDSGDNPTAGGAGDVTWTLHKLLTQELFKGDGGPKVVYASLPGPQAIRRAVAAGLDASVTVTAGAEIDDIHSPPVTMTGRVHSIKHGDKDALTEVVLQVGSIMVILTELRKPYHYERDFTDLNLSPRSADIVIVKIGYLEPELHAMAADWMLALTPGGVDQDLKRLGHLHIARPMWPFDTEFEKAPNLSARLISPSNEPLASV